MLLSKPLKNSFLSRHFYVRLLLSFILLTILIVVSIFIIFSNDFMKTLNNQITIDSINSVDKLNSEFDYLFKQMVQSEFLLEENFEIRIFLTGSNFDPLLINHVDNYITQIQNSNQYLNSIILYSKRADFPIISGKFDININQFLSGNIKRPNTKSIPNLVFSSTTDNVPLGAQSVETISSIFTDSDNSKGIFNSAVIMNFDKGQIEQKLLSKFDGYSLISDNDGHIIFSSAKDNKLSGFISNTPYFKEIQASGKKNGSFNIKLDNDLKIVTYTRNYMSGFYIINIKSFDSITKGLKDKKNYLIIISLIVIIVFALGAFFVSKIVYSPIKKITYMFSNSKYGALSNKTGEMDLISSVFNETLEHLKELELKSQDSNNRQKNDFLRHLLKSEIAILEKEMSVYNFAIQFDSLILVSAKVDNYTQINYNGKQAYITTLCKTIPELLRKYYYCETVDMFDGEIAILLNYCNSENNNFETLISSMDNLREVSKKTLGITLSIGIGGVSNSPENCASEYNKAVEVVKHRFILGTDKTLYQRYLDENLTIKQYFPIELESKLINSIKSNKKEVFVKNLEGIFELLKGYSYTEAISIFFQVVTSCIKTINSATTQQSNKFYLNFDELINIFSSLQTLDQAKMWLLNIFIEYQVMIDEINQLKNNKHYNLVEKIQININQNYNDINLSAESLADTIGYTPYYFSNIFKDITGLNVSDYIKQVRINKAKEILSVEVNKINEIPNMIGFTNISHFYAVFKKEVGLTPAAYREYALNREGSNI